MDNVYDSNYIELFWIPFTDLSQVLSKIEMDILTYGIYKATIDQHSFTSRHY